MGLAVDASRLFRSWVLNGIVLISAATLLHPSTANAASTKSGAKSAARAKPATKAKAKKKANAKTTAKTKVAKSAAAVAPKAAGTSRSGGKTRSVAARSRRGGKTTHLAKRSTCRTRALARAARPQTYVPNVEDYEILSIAARHLGTPYRFGGATEAGFDCSGFVSNVFSEVGMQLPHSARAQFSMGARVDVDELQPGDLVFFRTYRRDASHVGIYVGDSLFIHAASPGKDVRIDSLEEAYYKTRWLGARRMRSADS